MTSGVMRNSVRRWGRDRLRLLRRDERGVTIVEQLVTMSILGIVVGALVTLFVSGSKAEFDLNLRYQAQQQALVALDAFRHEVHDACSTSVSATSVTLTTADQTNASVGIAPCTVSSTWCTIGGGARYALYRQAGATCGSTGVKRADYITNTAGQVFSVTAPSVGSGLLPKIALDMTVNVTPNVSRLKYHLQDAIVIRNVARA